MILSIYLYIIIILIRLLFNLMVVLLELRIIVLVFCLVPIGIAKSCFFKSCELTDYTNSTDYIKMIRRRAPKHAAFMGSNCTQVKNIDKQQRLTETFAKISRPHFYGCHIYLYQVFIKGTKNNSPYSNLF